MKLIKKQTKVINGVPHNLKSNTCQIPTEFKTETENLSAKTFILSDVTHTNSTIGIVPLEKNLYKAIENYYYLNNKIKRSKSKEFKEYEDYITFLFTHYQLPSGDNLKQQIINYNYGTQKMLLKHYQNINKTHLTNAEQLHPFLLVRKTGGIIPHLCLHNKKKNVFFLPIPLLTELFALEDTLQFYTNDTYIFITTTALQILAAIPVTAATKAQNKEALHFREIHSLLDHYNTYDQLL